MLVARCGTRKTSRAISLALLHAHTHAPFRSLGKITRRDNERKKRHLFLSEFLQEGYHRAREKRRLRPAWRSAEATDSAGVADTRSRGSSRYRYASWKERDGSGVFSALAQTGKGWRRRREKIELELRPVSQPIVSESDSRRVRRRGRPPTPPWTISGRFGVPRHGAMYGAFSNGEGDGWERDSERILFLEAALVSCRILTSRASWMPHASRSQKHSNLPGSLDNSLRRSLVPSLSVCLSSFLSVGLCRSGKSARRFSQARIHIHTHAEASLYVLSFLLTSLVVPVSRAPLVCLFLDREILAINSATWPVRARSHSPFLSSFLLGSASVSALSRVHGESRVHDGAAVRCSLSRRTTLAGQPDSPTGSALISTRGRNSRRTLRVANGTGFLDRVSPCLEVAFAHTTRLIYRHCAYRSIRRHTRLARGSQG